MTNWQDYLEAVDGRASLLGRAILRGIVEPVGMMNPDVQIALAHVMAAELAIIAKQEGKPAFNRCAARALRWTIRDDTIPECGILLGMWLSQGRARVNISSPEWKAFKAKFDDIVP